MVDYLLSIFYQNQIKKWMHFWLSSTVWLTLVSICPKFFNTAHYAIMPISFCAHVSLPYLVPVTRTDLWFVMVFLYVLPSRWTLQLYLDFCLFTRKAIYIYIYMIPPAISPCIFLVHTYFQMISFDLMLLYLQLRPLPWTPEPYV